VLTWSQRKIAEKFNKTKIWAKERGLNFEISEQQTGEFWQKPCHYCTWAIPTIGLDRIDNAKGYVIDNLISSCPVCNGSKLVFSQAEYINHCRIVAAAHPGEIDYNMEEAMHRNYYRVKMQAYDRVNNVTPKQPEMFK